MERGTRLAGKVVIVTGAAQGLGATYARGLAAQGAAVALCDLLDPTPVVDEIIAAGGRALGAVLDVSHLASVQAFVQQVQDGLGPVDVLVNNAALFGGLERKPFTEIDADEWDRVMRVNTRGVLECSKAVVPGMKARGRGRIVNITSATLYAGSPLLMHYVASKGAVLAMTRSMARELGDFGIGVNALAPGLTMSESVKEGYTPAALAGSAARRCFKRDQQPEDLVGPLIFLASEDSAFITGQSYLVDGGALMQ